METTIKVTNETKDRIRSLDLAQKDKTFDMIINDLITSYQKNTKKYKKDYSEWERRQKDWEKQNKKYKQDYSEYQRKKETMDKLVKWAKSKGFRP